MPQYQHLGGERVEDVAIDYILESKFNMQANGKPVTSPDTSDTHTECSMQVASRLIRSHLPFGVITKSSLDQLDKVKVLILSNVHMMDLEECESIRRWVARGGKLIATGGTSLVDKLGRQQPDFMLADVLGVSIVSADWSSRNHYVAPSKGGEAILPEFSAKYPAFSEGQFFRVKAHEESKVLATTVLPWPRDDGSKFSSIHSDPPWQPTNHPEITRHAFGKGEAIYCNTLIEKMENAESALVRLVRMLNKSYRFEVEAPKSVEVTMFRQPDRNRYVMSLLNFQKELPNILVEGIRCRLNVNESIKAINELAAAASIPFQGTESGIEFRAPRLETLLQFEAVWS